jgi:hypothetical protein
LRCCLTDEHSNKNGKEDEESTQDLVVKVLQQEQDDYKDSYEDMDVE